MNKKSTMQPIKVHINELGAIIDSDIDITPVMIFSGESGLGKSYAAILSHYIFDMLLSSFRLNNFFTERNINFKDERSKYKDQGIALTIKKSEIEEWLSNDAVSYMKYMLHNDNLTADIQFMLPDIIDDEIECRYEEELLGFVEHEEAYIKLNMLGLTYRVKDETIEEESPYSVILRFGLINRIFGDFKALSNTFIFPPSRGTILTEDVTPQTGLYQRFKDSLEYISKMPSHEEDVPEELLDLLRKVLDGSVHRKDNKYLYRTHDSELPISAAAASVRELAPFIMLIERFSIKTTAMLIEEPEAHLHPLRQRMMADIISIMCSRGTMMQITTHSDYFLRRLNELISLYKLSIMNSEDEFNAIAKEVDIDPKLMLNPDCISAYLLERTPSGRSMIKKQDLINGVPFSAFTKAIDDSLSKSIKLNEYLENECI